MKYYIILLFVLFGCNRATQQHNKETSYKFLRLSYTVEFISDGEDVENQGNSASYTYEIDQHHQIVYEYTDRVSPIAHRVETEDSSKTIFFLEGDTDTTRYVHGEFFNVKKIGHSEINKEKCEVYTVESKQSGELKFAYIRPRSAYNIRFPYKTMSLGDSKDQIEFPFFNPELFSKGIPVKVMIPISNKLLLQSVQGSVLGAQTIFGTVDSLVSIEKQGLYICLRLLEAKPIKERTIVKFK